MTIAPTVSFSFVPTCQSLSCCFRNKDKMYPTKSGKFKQVSSMSDKEVIKANERFRAIITRKISHLPFDIDEFIDRLENEEGVSLTVTRENPLTSERLEDTVRAINRVIRKMKVV